MTAHQQSRHFHERVKSVFNEAVALPASERDTFVRDACGDDARLLAEVTQLLGHHEDDTILALDETPPAPPTLQVADSSLAEIETRQLIRRRLQAMVTVFAVALAVAVVHNFVQRFWSGCLLDAVNLLVMAACLAVLIASRELSLAQLRVIEWTVLISLAVQGAVIDIGLLHRWAEEGRVADVVSVNNWNYFAWSLTILIYGVFMPNDWRRAARVLLPAACVPYVVTYLIRATSEPLREALGTASYSQPVPAPFLAAFTAIYAAQLFDTSRDQTARAKQYAQYRLLRRIGKGGMGVVYEAEHILLKRPCALKLIRAERGADPKSLQRFEREVRATSQLSHPNTIEVFDFGRAATGEFYYVMELLPGMSLQQLVERAGPLAFDRAIHFLRQVCGALTEAHAANFVHRDIKPANIFAAERGGVHDFAKLLDFGLVRETGVNHQLSDSRTIAGTPQYMSPEQAVGREADARSDLYSLGAVGYFLLTGRPPFCGATPTATLIAQASDPPRPPSELRPEIPPKLEQVVLRCLEKQAADRFQTAEELEDALAACDGGAWSNRSARQWWQQHGGATLTPQSGIETRDLDGVDETRLE